MPELRPPPHPFLLASPFTPHSFLRLFVPSPDPRLSRPTPWVIGACGRTRTLWGDTGLAVPEPQPPGGGRGKCWAPTTPLPQLGDPRPLLPRVSYRHCSPAIPARSPRPSSPRASGGAEAESAPSPRRLRPSLRSPALPAPPGLGQAPRPCDPAARLGRDGTRWDGRRGSWAAWSGGGSSCCSTCCACWSVRAAGTRVCV